MTSAILNYVVEIEGSDTYFTSGPSAALAATTWANTAVEAIVEAIPYQSMTVDPYDGSFGNGGASIVSIEAPSYLDSRKSSNKTVLTADLAVGGLTATVKSTTGFSTSGHIYIGRECMSHTGKSATTFTGLTRAQRGTIAKAHTANIGLAAVANPVSDFDPTDWIGRKCIVREFDPINISGATVIFTGRIDGLEQDGARFTFAVISIAQDLEQPSVGSGDRARGTLQSTIEFYGQKQGRYAVYGDFKASPSANGILIQLDDDEITFPATGHIAMGSEVIYYQSTASPYRSEEVIAVTALNAGLGPSFTAEAAFGVGDNIRFTDNATSAVIDTKVTRVDRIATGSFSKCYHAANGMNPAVAATVTAPYLQSLSVLHRGQAFTDAEDHEIGTRVAQAYVSSENAVDGVLRMLISGNGSGGTYDTLGSAFGAGIATADIDVASFDSLRDYSSPWHINIIEPRTPKELLQGLASITGGHIYVGPDGQITARAEHAIYPDSAEGAATLDTSALTTPPRWRIARDRIYNMWVWGLTNGDTMTTRIEDSIALYGEQSLPSPPEGWFMASAVISDAAALALPILLQFATPSAEMTIQIPAESVVVYEPGTLISVTMLHIPDQAGGKGITSQLFKVYSYTSDGNTATVQMIRMLPGGNVGLVGPAGEVASASGSDIVLKAGATTHLAPTAGSLFSDITNGEDGTEDCHYFRAGDYIQIIDASTLGTTPASSTKIIDSVAYGSLTITLTTGIPAGIAAGDIVRLSDYDDTITAGNSLEAFYTWWANSSLVIPAGSSDPYQWGG